MLDNNQNASSLLQQMFSLENQLCELFGIQSGNNNYYDMTDRNWCHEDIAFRNDDNKRISIKDYHDIEYKSKNFIQKGDFILVIEEGSCCADDSVYLLNVNKEQVR
jgi:hypothetical protein